MADKKISQLTAATTPLAGTEVLPIVQGASTVKVPVNNLFENADSTTTGLLSSTDWSTFDGKAPAVTYTTNYIPFGQGTTTLNQSANLVFDGTSLGIESNSVTKQFTVRNTDATAGYVWTYGPNFVNTLVVQNQDGNGVYLANGATSWAGTSDERVKTDLIPIEDASNKVSTLRAVTGRYLKDDESVSRAFLIAQDVQKVFPQAVNVQPDEQGTLGIQYTDVIPLLVAAIKEQKTMIDQLQQRLSNANIS